MALKTIPPSSEPYFPDLCLYIWLASKCTLLGWLPGSHTWVCPKGTLICLQNSSPTDLSISAADIIVPSVAQPRNWACPWGFPSLYPTSVPLTSPVIQLPNSSPSQSACSHMHLHAPGHFSPGFLQQLSNQSPHLHGFPLCLRWLYNFSSKPKSLFTEEKGPYWWLYMDGRINEIVLGKREHACIYPTSQSSVQNYIQILSLPRLNSSMGSHFLEYNPVCTVPGHPPASSQATSQVPCLFISPTSQAFIWHRTFAYDIFSVRTLFCLFSMWLCVSHLWSSPWITLSWEAFLVQLADLLWLFCTFCQFQYVTLVLNFWFIPLNFFLIWFWSSSSFYYRISERSDHFFLAYIWIPSPGT